MAGYRRAYISTCEAFGWEGGPEFNTNIVQLRNWRERSNADRDQPRHFFSLPFQNILPAAYAPIKQMHLNCRGRNGYFLYRDRMDYTADDELLAIATAGQQEFQLGKWSIVDGVSYFRHVYALYAPDEDGTAIEVVPVVTVNGTPTVGFTTDPDRGLLIFDSPLAENDEVRWSISTFSLWVRFDNDRLPFSIDNRSGQHYVLNGSVELLEMPPPEPEPDSSSS